MAKWMSALKGSMTTMNNLEDLFMMQLKELYDIENQIIDALPKMVDSANSTELKLAFQRHLDVTMAQRDRLDRIFHRLGRDSESTTCEGIRGILDDASMIMNAKGDAMVKDAALIGAAQQVEHYEMASYGTARTFAQYLGWNDVADILQLTLDEEKNTDEELSKVAMSSINMRAA